MPKHLHPAEHQLLIQAMLAVNLAASSTDIGNLMTLRDTLVLSTDGVDIIREKDLELVDLFIKYCSSIDDIGKRYTERVQAAMLDQAIEQNIELLQHANDGELPKFDLDYYLNGAETTSEED